MDHSILTIFDDLQPREKAVVRAVLDNCPRASGEPGMMSYHLAAHTVCEAVLELAEPGLLIHDPVRLGGAIVGHLFVPGMVSPTARMYRRDALVLLAGALAEVKSGYGDILGSPAELVVVAVLALQLARQAAGDADPEDTVWSLVYDAAALTVDRWQTITRIAPLIADAVQDWRARVDWDMQSCRGNVLLDCLPEPTSESERLAELFKPATRFMTALVRELAGME